MRAAVVFVSAFVLSAICGCDGVKSPLQPTPSAVNAPAPISGPAELKISDASLLFSSNRDGLSLYWVEFSLTETSGRSGAVVKSVMVSAPGADTVEVPEQWWLDDGFKVRVDPGQTSDAFGRGGMLATCYCTPLIRSRGFPPFIVITVRFVDDTGRSGEVVTQFDMPASIG